MNNTTLVEGGQNEAQCKTQQQEAVLPTLMNELQDILYTSLGNDLGSQ